MPGATLSAAVASLDLAADRTSRTVFQLGLGLGEGEGFWFWEGFGLRDWSWIGLRSGLRDGQDVWFKS